MANMRIYSQSKVNTTTMIYPLFTQTSGFTATLAYIIDRKDNTFMDNLVWSTTMAATYTSLRITTTADMTLNAIVIKNITTTNCGQIKIIYNSGTSTFVISNGNTSSTNWNSIIPNGDLFLQLASTTVITSNISIRFDPLSTSADMNLSFSDIYLLRLDHEFTDNPAVGDYKPKLDRTEYKHKMSDGGTATYVIQDNFLADIKLKYVSATDRNALKAIYQTQEPIVFIPFPTGTGWDGEIYEVNWVDDFDLGFTDNYTGNGYNIKMKLEETPK